MHTTTIRTPGFSLFVATACASFAVEISSRILFAWYQRRKRAKKVSMETVASTTDIEKAAYDQGSKVEVVKTVEVEELSSEHEDEVEKTDDHGLPMPPASPQPLAVSSSAFDQDKIYTISDRKRSTAFSSSIPPTAASSRKTTVIAKPSRQEIADNDTTAEDLNPLSMPSSAFATRQNSATARQNSVLPSPSRQDTVGDGSNITFTTQTRRMSSTISTTGLKREGTKIASGPMSVMRRDSIDISHLETIMTTQGQFYHKGIIAKELKLITRKGGPEVLQINQRDDPTPGPNEVRIRVKATGINFADIMARVGLYPDAPPLPTVVGYEVAGIIDAIGPNVPESWMKKAVISFTRFKGYADTVIVPLELVNEKPHSLSFEAAASIPVVYLTAWMLLVHSGGLRKGQTVLIQNAGGGVGLAAIDIAKHIGAITIGTASGKKHEALKQRGLDHAIDYRTQDYVEEVKKITKGKGVDLIIDPVGGDEWPRNFSILRSGGRLGVFGASSLKETTDMFLPLQLFSLAGTMFKMPKWSPLTLMDGNKGVFGVNLGHMWDEADRLNEWMAE
ncbi:hypothetical protein HDU76_010369 [Blyttiomyces sp. JEL0837]|nr:hypothetical protein HDU76_010369 [Blyttiomyces sp. JEL0837]